MTRLPPSLFVLPLLMALSVSAQNLHEGTNIYPVGFTDGLFTNNGGTNIYPIIEDTIPPALIEAPPPLPAVAVDTNSITQTNVTPRTNFDQSMTLDWPSYSNPAQQYLAEMQCYHPLPDFTKLPTMNAEVQASYDLSNWFVAYSFGTNRPLQLVIHYTPDSVPQTVYYRWRLCQ